VKLCWFIVAGYPRNKHLSDLIVKGDDYKRDRQKMSLSLEQKAVKKQHLLLQKEMPVKPLPL
jgi:hypothetical protein